MEILTLEEAISTYKATEEQNRLDAAIFYDARNFETSRECIWAAKEYEQLVKWLKELKNFREAIPRIIEASWDHTFEFKGDDESMTYKICALETVLEILGGSKDDS